MSDKLTQCKQIVEYIREKGLHHVAGGLSEAEGNAACGTNHGLGKRGLCVYQAAFEGGRLQAAGYALFDC